MGLLGASLWLGNHYDHYDAARRQPAPW
jgi:hypothetical protein